MLLAVVWAAVTLADELARAEQLAWSRQFAASEAIYRRVLEQDPASHRAQLGLARVILWDGRYSEAIARFDALLRANTEDVDALEGRGTARYWSGDFRGAAHDFRRTLQLEPKRETARSSLAEITAATRPSQRLELGGVRDDQPLDVDRGAISATFFSDPLSRWTATLGAMHFDAGDRGARQADFVRLENETRWRDLTFSASAGSFDESFVGGAGIRWRQWSLRSERREEVASATSLRAKAFSTTTALRWSHERTWIAVAEASHRRYSDDNAGLAAVAYFVAPVRKRGPWTLWAGASAAARDTDETRFHPTAVSSIREGSTFRYRYRGEYDPYWTPDDLVEARAVLALEREFSRGTVKLHADGGAARDQGRAFGPDTGAAPVPLQIYAFPYDRAYSPYRFGLSADLAAGGPFRIEVGVERSVTVDYRSTSFHAALVRRR